MSERYNRSREIHPLMLYAEPIRTGITAEDFNNEIQYREDPATVDEDQIYIFRKKTSLEPDALSSDLKVKVKKHGDKQDDNGNTVSLILYPVDKNGDKLRENLGPIIKLEDGIFYSFKEVVEPVYGMLRVEAGYLLLDIEVSDYIPLDNEPLDDDQISFW